MARRNWKPLPPIEYTPAPPCDVCGDESDDRLDDGRRVCWKHDPTITDQERARILSYALGHHYLRPIF